MSFYGQVVYEFKKLFNKIRIGNSGSTNNNIPLIDNSVNSIDADSAFDILNIDTGNRWVALDSAHTQAGHKILISHAGPGEQKDTINSFKGSTNVIDFNGEYLLSAGSSFKTSNFQFDAAGHFVQATETTYKLPPAGIIISNDEGKNTVEISTDANGKFRLYGSNLIALKSNNNIISIEHKAINPNSADTITVTQLSPGDSFIVYDTVRDECGHVTGEHTTRYTLPITDLDADLSKIKKDIIDLQRIKANQEDYLVLKETVDGNKIKIDSFPNTYLSLEKSGAIEDLYESSNLYTFASTIGNVDGNRGYSKNIANLLDEEEKIYTVSESLSAIAIKSMNLSSSIDTINDSLTVLRSRITVLEEKLTNAVEK